MSFIDDLKKLTFEELLENETVKKQFVHVYDSCYGSGGEVHFLKETDYLRRLVGNSAALKKATPLSFFAFLMDLAYHGTSIEPISKPLAYCQPQNYNVGTRDTPKWETRAEHKISPYGELYLRMRSGTVKYAENPVLVVEGDEIKVIDNVVHHTKTIPRISDKIIGGYIRITRTDGSREDKWYDIAQLMHFKASADEKQQKSKFWTGGIGGQAMEGMLEAKIIKHSFKTYPRLKLGKATKMADESDMERQLIGEDAYAAAMASFDTEEGITNDGMPSANSEGDQDDFAAQNTSFRSAPKAQSALSAEFDTNGTF
jgi:recombinational DNA repair protein RecT